MALKILHTSDWHLGKKLFKVDRHEEQIYCLDWLLNYLKEEAIDVLLIAGDIFDSPTPPNESVKLFYKFLKDASFLQIFYIAGNHDSGKFLDAPRDFFKMHNIHVIGNLPKKVSLENIKESFNELYSTIEIKGEKVGLFSLPYFRSHELFSMAKQLDIAIDENKEDSSLLSIFDYLFENIIDRNIPNILMAHHLFGNFDYAGSELGLFLSGLSSIPIDRLKPHFKYVALGHIHKYQVIKKQDPIVIYPGSPIPFRFNESKDKRVSLLTIKDNEFSQKPIPVPQKFQMRTVSFDKENWEHELNKLIKEQKKPLLLDIVIKLENPSPGLFDQIREKLKQTNIKAISIQIRFPNEDIDAEMIREEKQLSTQELFQKFYKYKFQTEDVPDSMTREFQNLLKEAQDTHEA